MLWGVSQKKWDEIIPLNHHLEVIKSPNISSSWSYLPLYPYCKITKIKCETTYIPHDIPMNFRKAAGLCPPLLCTSAWLVHLHFPLGPTEVPHLSVTRRIYQTQNKKCVCVWVLVNTTVKWWWQNNDNSFHDDRNGYGKSIAYRNVFEMQKSWAVEVVRSVNESRNGAWDANEMTGKESVHNWMNESTN